MEALIPAQPFASTVFGKLSTSVSAVEDNDTDFTLALSSRRTMCDVTEPQQCSAGVLFIGIHWPF